jgi:hypothetical protein
MTQVNVTSASAAQVALAQSQRQSLRAAPSTNTSSEALARLSQRTAQFVTALSNSKNIAPQQKEAMIDVATLVDSFVKNPAARNKFYRDLAGIGVFIGKQAQGKDFPYYPTLTGLRYYDSLRSDLLKEPAHLEDMVQIIDQKMTALAQASGASDVEAAVADVMQDAASRAEVAQFVSTDTRVEGFGESNQSDAPESSPKVDTTA